jgi:hypothetical protein
VHVKVCVHAARDGACSFYDGHGHPYLPKWSRGGTAVPDRSDGRPGLFEATRASHPSSGTGRAVVNVQPGDLGRRVADTISYPLDHKSDRPPGAPEITEDQPFGGGPRETPTS